MAPAAASTPGESINSAVFNRSAVHYRRSAGARELWRGVNWIYGWRARALSYGAFVGGFLVAFLLATLGARSLASLGRRTRMLVKIFTRAAVVVESLLAARRDARRREPLPLLGRSRYRPREKDMWESYKSNRARACARGRSGENERFMLDYVTISGWRRRSERKVSSFWRRKRGWLAGKEKQISYEERGLRVRFSLTQESRRLISRRARPPRHPFILTNLTLRQRYGLSLSLLRSNWHFFSFSSFSLLVSN